MLIKVSYHLGLRWKVMRLRSPRDTRFQSTLNGVTSQVIGSLIAFTIQKYPCLPDSNFGQLVEVGTVHFNSSILVP